MGVARNFRLFPPTPIEVFVCVAVLRLERIDIRPSLLQIVIPVSFSRTLLDAPIRSIRSVSDASVSLPAAGSDPPIESVRHLP